MFSHILILLTTTTRCLLAVPGVDFEAQIKPILETHCLSCHGPEQQKGKLRFDTLYFAKAGGKHGQTIVPGKAEDSPLYKRITLPAGDDDIMPPEGDPINAEEAEVIRLWIDLGAHWPTGTTLKPRKAGAVAETQTKPPLFKRIDELIEKKLQGPPAGPSSDSEFFRRVYLDLTGSIPPAVDVSKFLADPNPEKRTALIERLLGAPEYARSMANKFSIMLLERRDDGAADFPLKEWETYLTHSFEANKQFDEIAADIIAVDGFDPNTKPAIKFYMGRDQPTLTRDVSRLFLGRDIQCAECHDHPSINDYKQSEFQGLTAYLNGSNVHKNPKTKMTYFVQAAMLQKIKFKSVFTGIEGEVGPKLVNRDEVELPQYDRAHLYLGGYDKTSGDPQIPRFQRRRLLAKHLPDADNRAFVRNAANRLWFMFMGRGLVMPLDQDHSKNPPTHPELLDLLTEEFVERNLDIRDFVREILLSRAYQRSSILPEGMPDVPEESYAVFNMRPLSAEQLGHSVMLATGNLGYVLDKPKRDEAKAKQAEKEKVARAEEDLRKDEEADPLDPDFDKVLAMFRSNFANAPGDPEIEYSPSTTGALFLTNEGLFAHWLKPHDKNLIENLMKGAAKKEYEKMVQDMYLNVLSRAPDDEEKKAAIEYLAKNEGRISLALGEYVWSLLASTEFRMIY
ncbi:MAG: DUF1553 domain-containing protein [Planctomycetota bacterium]|nr:DUF1553 domain-containing protein [Planctomycetota bacterium]